MRHYVFISVFGILCFSQCQAFFYPPEFPTHTPKPTPLPSYTTEPPKTFTPAPTPAPEGGLEMLQGVEGRHNAPASSSPKPPQPPKQAYSPAIPRRQLSPMQSESHDYFMGRPQPQANPPGPEVNPAYGDYSIAPSV